MTFFLSVIAALLLFVNLLLNFPLIQTWLTHRLASYYSAKLHAKVEIGKVDFEFMKKLVLRKVFIQDLHKDTILYAQALKFDIGALDFNKHSLYASNVILDEPRLHFITYKGTHCLNLQFIIDALASKDTTQPSKPGPKWNFRVGSLVLNNADFHLENQNDTNTYTGIIFSNMRIHHINLKASDILFQGDTLRAVMESLTAREQTGFELDKFNCYVKLSSVKMELNALNIETPQTKLSTDLVFHYSKFPDFFDFVNKVNMQASFRKSTVCFDDFAYFAGGLQGVHNCFTISGQYSGTVSDLRGRNMDIGWGKVSSLQGDATLTGLPDINKTLIKIYITRLVTCKNDVEMLPTPPFDRHQYLKLPDNMAYLGTIDLHGSFDGYISDFRANMAMASAIGGVSGELSMRQDTVHNVTYYKGTLGTESFDLGKFWQNNDLGTITSSVSIEGKGLKRSDADAEITGSVENFMFKKYDYKNLALSGELRKGFFSGLLEVEDPNLQMDFNGDVDIASNIHSYHFNTYIRKAELQKLNLIHDSIGPVMLSTHMEVNLKGNTIDDMDGTIHMDSTRFDYHKDKYHLHYLDATSAHGKGEFHTISVFSDYADAKITGYFPVVHLPQCITNMLSYYIPAKFQKVKIGASDKEDNSYDFTAKFNENTGLTNLFIPTLIISKGATIEAHYREHKNSFSLTGQSALVEWGGKKLKNWDITVSGNETKLNIKSGCDTLFVNDSLYAAGFNIKGSVSSDTTHYSIKWNNDSANYADIPGYIAFPNKTDVLFRFVNPLVNLGDSMWQVTSQNMVSIDTSGIIAKNLEFYHTHQSISVQGKLSKQKNDAMVVTFHQLNLKDFNLGTVTDIQGTIDGTVSVANIYASHPFFAGALNFNNLIFNKQFLGDGSVNSFWDNEAKGIAINGKFVYHDTTLLSFEGNYYDRDTNNLSIDAGMHELPLKIFQPYIKDYCSEVDGGLNGTAHIFGNLNKPLFSGNVTAGVKRIKLDYLNTYYHSPGIEVAISPDTFRILPSPLLDDKQDTAIASGTITHNHFKNIQLDFNIDANDFMCLNTDESNNNLYFGTGYATGNVQIYGPLNNIHIDANITTEKGTQFNIPLSNAAEVDQGDFIRFINKKDTGKKQQTYKVATGGLQVDFTVHATKDANAQLIFDKKVGDVLTGSGNGTMQLHMNTLGEFNMKGNYTVEKGTYLLMLKGMLNKQFVLESGGTINWTGDPYNADIDLRASYSLFTSLAPFFPDDSTGVYKKNFPVNCELLLSGKLLSPNIGFNIDLPSVDQSTKDIVAGYLTTQDELNRQAFSLLILKQFVPIQERSNANPSQLGQFGGISGYELLSDQLSHILSGINNKFNIGVQIQPGSATTNQEVKAMFQTQLFNDRVSVISDVGTVGAIGTQGENTNNFVGEITVETKVSKDGKVKVKAFNKANDNTAVTLTNAPYTQGVGISYREGFNTFGELWDRIVHKSKRKPKKASPATSSTQ